MASAVLASRNEPYWGDRKVYMRKNSNSNANPRLGPNHNPNPNSITYENVGGRHDANLGNQKDCEPAAVAGAALSEDSSSLNRKLISLDTARGVAASYISFNVSCCTKKELRELKRRLVAELEQVRSVTSRIESWELQSSARSVGYSASGIYCSNREVTSPAAPQQNHLLQIEPFVEKEMKISESKMLLPFPKRAVDSLPSDSEDSKKLLSGIMKKCAQILGRLMKHKGGIWFNSPVDVEGMALHDYRLIIKHPMDLGTVRLRLKNGFYSNPFDFAEDIRLTFNNALIYNPETHEVHKLAAQLLRQFEGLFGPAHAKYEKQQLGVTNREDKLMGSSWPCPVPEIAMRAEPKPVPAPPPPVQIPVPQQSSLSKPVAQPCVPPSPPQQLLRQQYPITSRSIGGKLPKPKAKDPNKRPMSFEEREKLSSGLQSLPEEKMSQVLQIVKKRNVGTQQDGDEIVLDFEIIDTETLWELDRFLCNCKKMLSKIRRQEALAGNIVSSAPASLAAAESLTKEGGHNSLMVDGTTEAMVATRSKKGDPDEDIDIGEEMPPTSYPSVEIEKDDGYDTSSSSSGSDSSSSSDSDSGSSSRSDSDDSVHSPGGGFRSSPRN